MRTLLQINTGIFGDQSNSTTLANEFTALYAAQHKGVDVVVRDLISEPIPHLDASSIMAFTSEPDKRTAQQQAIVDFSQSLIDELSTADAVVIGLPMYNFSVPSQFKAYMDQVARAGVTFKYTETGVQGLLEDKPVYVMAARGGMHQGQPSDSQTGLIRSFFSLIGLNNIQFIYAEGLNMGDEVKATAYQQARASMQALFS